MSGLSNYLNKAIINSVLRGIPYVTPPVTELYLALFTADPTDEGSLANEVPAGWYVRQPAQAWAAPAKLVDPAVNGYETFNLQRIDYPVVTGPDVIVTHLAIMDAQAGGNVLLSSALRKRKILEEDDSLSFAIGTTRFILQNIDSVK